MVSVRTALGMVVCAFAVAAAGLPVAPARADLIAHWPFDGTADDATGGGLDGTLQGGAAYSAVVPAAIGGGQSLDLDGTSGYVSAVPTGSPGGSYTVAAWARTRTTAGQRNIFATRGPSDMSFDMKLRDGADVHGDIGTGTAWLKTDADAPLAYAADTWYHVAYTVSAQSYKVYVDGAEAAAGTFGAGTPLLYDANHHINIGRYNGGSEYFDGYIDDVAVWNQRLTPMQLSALAAGTPPASITDSPSVSMDAITGDGDCGISSAKTYTHKLDFGTHDAGATVNGVRFYRPEVSELPANVSYDVTSGTPTQHGGNAAHNVTGGVADVLYDMIYDNENDPGGTATLKLGDLRVGQQYQVRIYNRQWDASTDRTAVISFDTNADGVADDQVILDQNNAATNPPGLDAPNRAYALTYNFTAASPTLAVRFDQQNQNQSWHVYGVTNEQVSTPAGPAPANAGFEDPQAFPYPGYGAPPGWTSSDTSHTGVNDRDGPFVNGQVINEGAFVGLLQRSDNTTPVTISQTVGGFEPGKKYTVQYFESERGQSSDSVAHGWVTLGGEMVVAGHDVTRKDNRFVRVVSQAFTATSTSHALLFANRGTNGDNTLLLDDIRITRAVPIVRNGGFEQPEFGPSGWSYNPAGADWEFTANSGVARNGSPWVNNGATPEGRQAGYIQGQNRFRQTIDGLEPGATYALSWQENLRAGQGGANSYAVLLDGIEVFRTSAGDVSNGWSIETGRSLVAHGTTAVLEFQSRYDADGLSGDRSTLFDDVHFHFVEDIGGRVNLGSIPGELRLYNTGRDTNTDGVDDRYALITTPGGGAGTAYVTTPHPNWAPNDAASQWIGPQADAGAGGVAPGEYLYETLFDLSNVYPETLSINGRFWADNEVLDVLLNGESLGLSGGGFQAWTAFQLNEGFVLGENRLQFLVSNGTSGGLNPSGLRVQFDSAYGERIVPEPATLALLAVGIGGVGLRLRRRRGCGVRG